MGHAGYTTLPNFAARLGFEPRYTAPEAVVLPLDDLAIAFTLYNKIYLFSSLISSFPFGRSFVIVGVQPAIIVRIQSVARDLALRPTSNLAKVKVLPAQCGKDTFLWISLWGVFYFNH